MPLPLIQNKKPLNNIRHIIGIAAGKGGVGKSSVTTHLARVWAKEGYKVGILDADIYGPSIRKMLPEELLPEKRGGEFFPAECGSIKVMSMAYFREEIEAAAVRAPIVSSLIIQFLKEINWGPLDFLLIDFPPGTGDIQLTLCQQASLSGVVLVTTPQEVAALDVKKAIHLFEQMKVPLLGVIENMSYYRDPTGKQIALFGEGAGVRLAHSKKIPFLGAIPLDPEISLSGDTGRSIFETDPLTESAGCYLQLANVIANSIKPAAKPHIYLKDPHTLVIESSEKNRLIPLRDLQKSCPCAICGATPPQVDDNVTATQVTLVGSYAVRLQFSSGCSRGLYTFSS